MTKTDFEAKASTIIANFMTDFNGSNVERINRFKKAMVKVQIEAFKDGKKAGVESAAEAASQAIVKSGPRLNKEPQVQYAIRQLESLRDDIHALIEGDADGAE